MKKEIIKCDKCKRILDNDKDGHYYEIIYRDMPGWITGERLPGEKLQICEKCFKEFWRKKTKRLDK